MQHQRLPLPLLPKSTGLTYLHSRRRLQSGHLITRVRTLIDCSLGSPRPLNPSSTNAVNGKVRTNSRKVSTLDSPSQTAIRSSFLVSWSHSFSLTVAMGLPQQKKSRFSLPDSILPNLVLGDVLGYKLFSLTPPLLLQSFSSPETIGVLVFPVIATISVAFWQERETTVFAQPRHHVAPYVFNETEPAVV